MKNMFSVYILIAGLFLCKADTLTLPEAQHLVFENNHRLLISRKESDVSRAALEQARSAWHPHLSASANYGYQTEEQTLDISLPPPIGAMERTIGDKDRVEFGADISWPVFTGFGRMYRIKSRESSVKAAGYSTAQLKERLSFELGMLYFGCELAQKTVDNHKDQVERLGKYCEHIRELHNAGMAIRADIAKAEARLAGARVALLSAQNRADSLRGEIAVMTGIENRSLTFREYAIEIDSADVAAMVTGPPLQNKPVVKALDMSVEQLRSFERAAGAERWPSLAVSAGYRYADPGPSLGGDGFTGYGIAGMRLSWKLYDGFTTRANLRQIELQQQIVKERREELLADLKNRVRTAQQGLQTSLKQIEAARLAVDASEQHTGDIRNAVDAGTATSLEYLNALQDRADARLMHDRAVFSYKQQYLMLRFASGKQLCFE
ncbi:MAG: hypothetical protein GF401_15235 [Chitinivibrionales bacterium]|nr:hypothetical protein [Chitinivibrionales bacterium]